MNDSYTKRPGRVLLTGDTDPNPNSHFYFGNNVGSIVQIGDKFLHVEKVERRAYGLGEGDEIFGYNTFGIGHFITAAKADKLRAAWKAKQKVRDIEIRLRVAQTDDMSTAERIQALRRDLEKAKATAAQLALQAATPGK